MRYEIVDSGLRPEDIANLGAFEHLADPNGQRGPLTDMLVGTAANMAAAGIGGTVSGLWLAWKARRERQLLDGSATSLTVEITLPDGQATTTVLDLPEDLPGLEVAVTHPEGTQVIITFPTD